MLNRKLSHRGTFTSSSGFSLIEILIVLAIVGVLLGLSSVIFRPPSVRVFANDLSHQIQQGRFEALKRNRPVSVIYNGTSFETRWDSSSPTVTAACSGDTVVQTKRFEDYPQLSVTPDFVSGEGIVWLPSGQARSCSNTTFQAQNVVLSNGRSSLTMRLATNGKVTF